MTDIAHPYIPNSAPEARRKALEAIGVDDIEDLYAAIPERLRIRRTLDLPDAIRSEQGLRRHVERILSSNRGTRDYLSFLGGGCWEHLHPYLRLRGDQPADHSAGPRGGCADLGAGQHPVQV